MHKKIVISLSADIEGLKQNKLFDLTVAKKYPGSEWAYEFKRLVNPSIDVVTADIALKHVQAGRYKPSDIFVIQHGFDQESMDLIGKGGIPFLLYMYESPLYAGIFYDHVKEFSKIFNRVMVFGVQNSSNSVPIKFPSFSKEKLKHRDSIPQLEFDRRKFSSMVVSNKFVLTGSIFSSESLADFVWRVLKKVKNYHSKFYLAKTINLDKIQLQTKRLDILISLGKRGLIDLFGRGWKGMYRLPLKYQKLFKQNFNPAEIKTIGDKYEYLSRYKFNICYENVVYPDYITEKIFDALVAGTVPVYWGSEDICNYIPRGAYIDASKFSSADHLVNYLVNLSKDEWVRMIQVGQEFLRSFNGEEFSYENIASNIHNYFSEFLRSKG